MCVRKPKLTHTHTPVYWGYRFIVCYCYCLSASWSIYLDQRCRPPRANGRKYIRPARAVTGQCAPFLHKDHYRKAMAREWGTGRRKASTEDSVCLFSKSQNINGKQDGMHKATQITFINLYLLNNVHNRQLFNRKSH